MITEEVYKKALHIVKLYESEQLLIHNVVNCEDIDHNLYINYDGECGACGSSVKK